MYAVIFIPDFALQAALRHLPQMREVPVGLIPEKTARARLLQCTAAARQAGAAPGMTPSQAQARCPELQVLIRSPEAERCAQAALRDCASAFSAYVEDTAEGICSLELKRTRDLQPEQLAESVLARLARLHLQARVGFAPNADLALLAAQSTERWRKVRGASELGGLPLERVAFPAPMLQILHRWGIGLLAPFAALGQEALAERLGPEVLPLLAQAQGRVERPLRCVRLAETYEESVEFEHEYDTLEPLLFIIRRLLEQITLRLETTYLVAAHLTLRLGFANGGGEHERIFKIPAPTARAEVLYRALETYLEKFTAQQPINRLQLIATPCRPSRQQFSLFENALRDPNQFFETLARLIALLGQERVGMAALEDTHKPDRFKIQEVDLEPPAPRAQRPPSAQPEKATRPARPPTPNGQSALSSFAKTDAVANAPTDTTLDAEGKRSGASSFAEQDLFSKNSGQNLVSLPAHSAVTKASLSNITPGNIDPGSDKALPSSIVSFVPPAQSIDDQASSLPSGDERVITNVRFTSDAGEKRFVASRVKGKDTPLNTTSPSLPVSQVGFSSSAPRSLPIGLSLRRFRPPLPAEVELGHERQPIFLVTAALRGRALEALGPLHLSGEWWDNQVWHRFEWDVELVDGTLCRVYQEEKRWFLEGVYD